MTLVFYASPLIVLSKAGLLDSVLPLAKAVVLPASVAEEITRIDDPLDPAKIWIFEHSQWIMESPAIRPFITAWDLGAGESSVIALVEKQPASVAVLDDLAARRCAQSLGLHVVGTLGLILMAKRAGTIAAVAPALNAIVKAGLFISRHHLDAVLAQAGETR
jgi:predicted nucleic acid-binding protein